MKKTMPAGCFTALVTPFSPTGEIDWVGLERNIEFQIVSGVRGLVSVGTTGESPTLTPEEHNQVNLKTAELVQKWKKKKEYLFHLAGVGSNNLKETIEFSEAVVHSGAGTDGLLLVDPYYNGPSSFEIREHYYRPVATRYPDQLIIPYVIPGRTGCALSPEDLAILARRFENIAGVKEASGNLERVKKIRRLVPKEFKIFSGEDDKTFPMMADPEIAASGVVSVISNLAPQAVQKMCDQLLAGNKEDAEKTRQALDPLFKLVTVKTKRKEPLFLEEKGSRKLVFKEVEDRFRNPVPIKTMMRALGMPAGPCRSPLGKMLPGAVEIVRETLKQVWKENPWILEPIGKFYGVNIPERLDNDKIWKELTYQS